MNQSLVTQITKPVDANLESWSARITAFEKVNIPGHKSAQIIEPTVSNLVHFEHKLCISILGTFSIRITVVAR